jgi:hypothetical protein
MLRRYRAEPCVTSAGERLAVEYVLPLRWDDDAGLDELAGYLAGLSAVVDVTVVDGSPEPLFGRHAADTVG